MHNQIFTNLDQSVIVAIVHVIFEEVGESISRPLVCPIDRVDRQVPD